MRSGWIKLVTRIEILLISFFAAALISCGGGSPSLAPSTTVEALAILSQPSNQAVKVGQPASFSVTASGSSLKYQWRKNNADIGGAVSSSYTLPAAAMADNGSSFSVMVSDSTKNMTSSAASLTVTANVTAPSITSQPSNQSVVVDQTATFSVTATGTSPLAYQWSKNNSPITGATSSSYSLSGVLSDSGSTFTVAVSNTAGSVTSASAALTVTPSVVAPQISAQPSNQSVTAGQKATFTVIANGTAPLAYQWSKNNSVIPGATSSTYTTPAAVLADNASLFTVTVSNSASTVTSNTATLAVTAALDVVSILSQPGNQTVTAGDSATFSVAAAGTAPLSYQWSRNNFVIPGATANSYTIPATSLGDNGSMYSVSVSNSVSTLNSDAAVLTVKQIPTSIQGTATVPNSNVVLKDSLGAASSGTTDANGNFAIFTTGMKAPFLLRIQLPGGGSIYSVSADNQPNGVININPVTDAIVRAWYGAQGVVVDTAFSSPTGPNAAPQPLQVSLLANFFRQAIQLWLTNAGITDPAFSFISTSFSTGTTSGVAQLLSDISVNQTNGTTTITDGVTTEVITTTFPAAGTVKLSTLTSSSNGSSGSTISTTIPVQSADQSALEAIKSTMNSLADLVNAKGATLSSADLLSFLDPDFLEAGEDRSTFASDKATQLRGNKISFEVARITSLNSGSGAAEIVFTRTESAGGSSQIQSVNFHFKNEGGNWMLYGDQRIARIQALNEELTQMGASTVNSGPYLVLNLQAPQTTNGVKVLSGATVAPLTVGGQTIFGSSGSSSTALQSGPKVIETYQPSPSTSMTLNFDHFSLFSNALGSQQSALLGTPVTVTVTPLTGSAATYTLPINSFSSESIGITSLNTAAIADLTPLVTDQNLTNFPFNTPIKAGWTLPKTFSVGQVVLSAQLFTGDQTNSTGSVSMCTVTSDNPLLSVSATTGTITIPSVCNALPVLQINVVVSAIGTNGELSTAAYSFNGVNSAIGGGGAGGNGGDGSGGGTTISISSISPTQGLPGTTVVVTGKNLQGGSCQVGGAPVACTCTTNSCQFFTTNNLPDGPVSVTNSFGTATSAQSFTSLTFPLVSGFVPAQGYPGTTITISGNDMKGISGCTLNGEPFACSCDSSYQHCSGSVPADATSGLVCVQNPIITSCVDTPFKVLRAANITGFTPTMGSAGTIVTITGSNLQGSSCSVGGTPTSCYCSTNSCTAFVPAFAADGPWQVVTPAGTATSSGVFTVLVFPNVSGFFPSQGAAGSTFTISGNNLKNVSSCSINGEVTACSCDASNLHCSGTIPADGTTGPLCVQNPLGSSCTGTSFLVLRAGAITGFSPASGPIGTAVTITGFNLQGGSCSVNGLAASCTCTASACTAFVPAFATDGTWQVKTSSGTATSSGIYTVLVYPSVSGFFPSQGAPGSSFTISGNGLKNISSCSINGESVACSCDASYQHCSGSIPLDATTGALCAQNPLASACTATPFTVLRTAAITSFSPAMGPIGTAVTINGSNLQGGSCSVNGMAANCTCTATSCGAFVPAFATDGTWQIKTTSGTGTSSGVFTVLVFPNVSGFFPAQGAPGTSFTISGNGLKDVSSCSINGEAVSCSCDAARLHCSGTVPLDATSGPLCVQNPLASSCTATSFKVQN